jgi:Ankyrin repeats (3 copies)/Ankyrin repeat
MSFFKKLFGTSKKEKERSNEIELPWINSTENPWGLQLLDLRPITQTMLSSSQDPRMATNAISYSGEDGTTFFGLKPNSQKTINVNIPLPIDKSLQAGVLFIPNTMEHKWAIYFDGEYLIFVRSWLREVFVIAKTTQKNDELVVEQIIGEFTQDESPEFTTAVLNFLLLSHSNEEIIPAPLPSDLESDLHKAGLWAFSTYGNMAQIGVFSDKFIPKATKPLRSHSLLHIAVARGDISEIVKYAQNGVDLNSLAGDGLSPLHWSIASETTESMKKLIDLGADTNVRTVEGATPIMNAVQSNKIDKLNLLIKSGATINLSDNRGFTALHRASEMGHVEIVEILLKHGADKSIVAEGHTALSLATLTGQQKIIELLN